jgi:hypothetical protein
MHQTTTNLNTQNLYKINSEQVEEIVQAIIAGKYSWACVLILRFSGHNPIDYIPYRTYIRVLKNNYLVESSKTKPSENQSEKLEMFNLKSTWMRF